MHLSNRRGRVVVCLEHECSDADILKAMLLACMLHTRLYHSSHSTSTTDPFPLQRQLDLLLQSLGAEALEWYRVRVRCEAWLNYQPSKEKEKEKEKEGEAVRASRRETTSGCGNIDWSGEQDVRALLKPGCWRYRTFNP